MIALPTTLRYARTIPGCRYVVVDLDGNSTGARVPGRHVSAWRIAFHGASHLRTAQRVARHTDRPAIVVDVTTGLPA